MMDSDSLRIVSGFWRCLCFQVASDQYIIPIATMSYYRKKEGPLYKYRNRLKGWEYRYFKLTKSYLHYYEAQHAPSPKHSLVRSEIASVTQCTSFPDKNHCFQLVSKSHDKWYMVANSESEMEHWIKALTAHLPGLPSFQRSEPEQERLEQEETGTTSPTVPVPPLPHYMAQLMNEMPPSYDDCVPSKDS